MSITTCSACGKLYEESSDEAANMPFRLCPDCLPVKRDEVEPMDASRQGSVMNRILRTNPCTNAPKLIQAG